MSYTKNRMTRIVLDKIENDKRLRAIDRDQVYIIKPLIINLTILMNLKKNHIIYSGIN